MTGRHAAVMIACMVLGPQETARPRGLRAPVRGTSHLCVEVVSSALSVVLAVVLSVALWAGASSLVAQPLAPPDFADEIEFGEWVTYYYRNPQPERLPAGIEYYAGSSLFGNAKGRIPMAQFAAEVIRDEAGLSDQLVERATEGESEVLRAFTLHVLWLVDTDAARQRLDEAGAAWGDAARGVVEQMRKDRPVDLFSTRIASDSDLDRLWGIFLATGSVKPVEKVASLLASEFTDAETLRIRDAARWSLLSNAAQHERVRRYVGEFARRAEGAYRERLEEVIAQIDAGDGEAAPPATAQ